MQARYTDDADDEDEAIDLSNVIDRTMTPMKDLTPTTSERGDDAVVNAKHFGRNDRLHDEQAVESSVRRSLRLSPSPASGKKKGKKTIDPSKVKSSLNSTPKKVSAKKVTPVVEMSSSCRDTAPLAKPAKKKLTQVKTPAKNTPAGAADNTTASERKAALTKRPPKSTDDTPILKVAAGDTSTAASRKAVMDKKPVPSTSKKGKASTSANVSLLSNSSTSTAGERRAAMVKKRARDDSESGADCKKYGVELQWYDKHGPAYRKAMEKDSKKKDKSKDADMAALIQEKTDTLKKLTDNLNAVPSTTAAMLAEAHTTEQLWADSLIPHMKAMGPDVMDDFMVHVLGIAIKAKKGRWPEN